MYTPTREELCKLLDTPIFRKISETADELGMECYVVGGYVRDIFLERPSTDIDVVVVGKGIEMARAFSKKLGRKAHLAVYANFGTAQVKYGNHEIEFVGARKESYSHDSRNPIVEDGTLEDDQNRRDFTINAMAICLNANRLAIGIGKLTVNQSTFAVHDFNQSTGQGFHASDVRLGQGDGRVDQFVANYFRIDNLNHCRIL